MTPIQKRRSRSLPGKQSPPPPKTRPPLPKTAPPLPKTTPPLPKTAPPLPKTAPPLPKTVPPLPKAAPPLPKTAPPLPKTAPPPPTAPAPVAAPPGQREWTTRVAKSVAKEPPEWRAFEIEAQLTPPPSPTSSSPSAWTLTDTPAAPALHRMSVSRRTQSPCPRARSPKVCDLAARGKPSSHHHHRNNANGQNEAAVVAAHSEIGATAVTAVQSRVRDGDAAPAVGERNEDSVAALAAPERSGTVPKPARRTAYSPRFAPAWANSTS